MRTTGNALHLNPEHDWRFCLQKYELAVEKHEFERIIKEWNEGASLEFIAKQQRRPWQEIFLILFDAADSRRKLRPVGYRLR